MFFFNNENDITQFKPRSVEHAYVAIINNDLKSAQAVFESIDSPRANWGKSLTDILSGFIDRYPTYFEIRNFMEIDLEFLIKNGKIDYTELLLGALEFLSEINQEAYKYAARVMYENKLYPAAKNYMEKSKDIFYNDPELHYMLAKYYLDTGDYVLADNCIKECLKILPDYYPAKIFQAKLTENFA